VSARLAPYPDNPATIGEIAPILDATFSLEVTQGQARKNLECWLDGDTEVEGKLQIGSQATVEDCSVGQERAMHVVVAPAAGLQAR
jgi:hypothetical protein